MWFSSWKAKVRLVDWPPRSNVDHCNLQDDINKLDTWVNTNYLQFNTSKCKYMVVSRKRSDITPPSLIMLGHHLEHVECFKYLGLLLSTDLSWTAHVESVCSKARKLLGLLYRKYVLSICWTTDPTPVVHIPGTSTLRICQSSMESLPADKYKHTRGGSEICPQDVLQAMGSSLLPTAPAILAFLLWVNDWKLWPQWDTPPTQMEVKEATGPISIQTHLEVCTCWL